jgi:predicted acylesterase/phospholipase RssA
MLEREDKEKDAQFQSKLSELRKQNQEFYKESLLLKDDRQQRQEEQQKKISHVETYARRMIDLSQNEVEQTKTSLDNLERRLQIETYLSPIPPIGNLKRILVGTNPIDVDPTALVRQIKYKTYQQRDQILEEYKDLELDFRRDSARKLEKPIYCGLSLDGGGIRGLHLCLCMEEIERVTGKRTAELFDFIGGTSIGGIIALGLTVGEYQRPYHSAKYFTELLCNHSKSIFPREKNLDLLTSTLYTFKDLFWSARYSAAPLRDLLENSFYEARLSQAIKPVLTTAVHAVDNSLLCKKVQTFESLEALADDNNDFLIIDAALATSAAPTFFPAAEVSNIKHTRTMNLVDGGLWYNNPSQLVYNRMMNHFSCSVEDMMLVSIGTGKSSGNSNSTLPKSASLLRAAKPTIEAMIMANTEGVHEEMCRIKNLRYHRIQPFLEREIQLDDSSEDALEDLKLAAASQYRDIRPMARTLLKNYDLKKDIL